MKSVLWVVLLLPAAALGQEERVQLKEGPGRDLVVASCSGCHSLDYIPMNSPFLDRKGWEKEVDKMMKAFGAAIEQKNTPPIVDYLTRSYGKP